MDKIKHLVGIDISKNTFDVYSSQRGNVVIKNPLGLSDEEIRDMRITVVDGSNPEEEVSNR